MRRSIDLYGKEDLKVMKLANKIKSPQKDRLEQIIEYLKNSKYKKIGIVNCIALQEQAEKLFKILKDEGFTVFKVNCREGELDKSSYDDKDKGSSCNPAYQAKFMSENNVDFVIVLGLCLGHDLIFQKHCSKPYTTLVVKDYVNKHKTIELFE